MNFVCHGEERSDVAIHLEFPLDCRARQAGLAMTNGMSSITDPRSAGRDEAIYLIAPPPRFADQAKPAPVHPPSRPPKN
jgi:hypothetical protein